MGTGTLIIFAITGTGTLLALFGIGAATGYYIREFSALRSNNSRMADELQTQNRQISDLLVTVEALRQRTARNNGSLSNLNKERVEDIAGLLGANRSDIELISLRNDEIEKRFAELLHRERRLNNDNSKTNYAGSDRRPTAH